MATKRPRPRTLSKKVRRFANAGYQWLLDSEQKAKVFSVVLQKIVEELKIEKDIADKEALANPDKALEGDWELKGIFYIPR